jgi:hypothetical protein
MFVVIIQNTTIASQLQAAIDVCQFCQSFTNSASSLSIVICASSRPFRTAIIEFVIRSGIIYLRLRNIARSFTTGLS